jgi:hypothetical protein
MSPRRGIWLIWAGLIGCFGCGYAAPRIVGSGVITGQSYDLTDFERITIHGDIDVTVLQGEGFAVELSADDNLIDLVQIVQHGEELRIGWSRPVRLERAHVVCVVHLPKLTGAAVHGVSKLHLKSLTADTLHVTVTGASRVDGELTGGAVTMEVSGASQARLVGQAETLDASISGASTAKLEGLTVSRRATIEASGASTARIHAIGELGMSASGASSVIYLGSPTITRSNANGASSIRPEPSRTVEFIP